MKPLIERLCARLADPEKVIGRPGWKDPKNFPPASAEVLDKAEQELGFRLPQLLRTIYLEVANGGVGPSLGLLGITGGHTDDCGMNAVALYHANRSWNDLQHESDDDEGHDDDEDLSEAERDWAWPEFLLPICYRGCTVYESLDCSSPDPPVTVVDFGDHDWNQPLEQTAPSLAVWFETWLNDTDSPEPSWLKRLDDGQDFQTVTQAGFSATPMRSAGMPYLVKLKNLEGLCLSGCPVSDESLVHLRELTRLESLKLHSAPTTDQGLAHLASLANLIDLDLAETRVTGAGLAYLTALSLRTLNLAHTKVSDAGLRHLHPLKTLRNLDLTCVPISEQGLAALKAALPGCEVVWWPPAVPPST